MVIQNNEYNSSKSLAQIFTPSYIADFMVKNLINIRSNSGEKEQSVENLKILEPSSGEGIFLERLIENNFKNIMAYEIDSELKEDLVIKFPRVNFKFENFLSSLPKEEFDIIIGNPPYLGQNYNTEVFQEIVKKYSSLSKYFIGNMDLFYFFIHLGILKLKPKGYLSFITTNYWISKSKKTGVKFLKPHINKECYLVQYIDLSNLRLFRDAQGQHNCIFVLQKKTPYEKRNEIDRPVEIIHFGKKTGPNLPDEQYNKKILEKLISNKNDIAYNKYTSALSNNDLALKQNWHLLYPNEVKEMNLKIERSCYKDGKVQILEDKFLIRNGLILIKDDIFILKEKKDIIFDENGVLIKIGGQFRPLLSSETKRIKKVYKSRVIKAYGYNEKDLEGFLIYFNKNNTKVNQQSLKEYPTLIGYLKQYKDQLKEILKNAKENPENIYYPRRGSHIKQKYRRKLLDLEEMYDSFPKIIFKFISQENVFGFCPDEYYATSDTYFLWPIRKDNYNIYFLLAYLNSNIIRFIFKSKNLTIKRSKTKLEKEIPLPLISGDLSFKMASIVKLIELISKWLVLNIHSHNLNSKKSLYEISDSINEILKIDREEFYSAIEHFDFNYFRSIIDDLFYQYFDLDGKEIDYLIKQYYTF